jgi:hypothetical protein
MRAQEFLAEISRRDMLKSLAAAGLSAAGVQAQAQYHPNPEINQCIQYGIDYFKEVGSWPRLSTGVSALQTAIDRCKRSKVAFTAPSRSLEKFLAKPFPERLKKYNDLKKLNQRHAGWGRGMDEEWRKRDKEYDRYLKQKEQDAREKSKLRQDQIDRDEKARWAKAEREAEFSKQAQSFEKSLESEIENRLRMILNKLKDQLTPPEFSLYQSGYQPASALITIDPKSNIIDFKVIERPDVDVYQFKHRIGDLITDPRLYQNIIPSLTPMAFEKLSDNGQSVTFKVFIVPNRDPYDKLQQSVGMIFVSTKDIKYKD